MQWSRSCRVLHAPVDAWQRSKIVALLKEFDTLLKRYDKPFEGRFDTAPPELVSIDNYFEKYWLKLARHYQRNRALIQGFINYHTRIHRVARLSSADVFDVLPASLVTQPAPATAQAIYGGCLLYH